MKRVATCFLVAMVACGGGDDDVAGPDAALGVPDAPPGVVCGDGVCNGGETCTSCVTDCGVCPPGCGDGVCSGGETCETCSADCGVCLCDDSDPYSCDGDTICLDGSCEPAWGAYGIFVLDFTVATQNQEGTAWDTMGGAPDPYVTVELGGELVMVTAEPQDTFDPVYSDSASINVSPGLAFEFHGWDGDVDSDDWIIGCIAEPLTAEHLRWREVSCVGSAATGTQGTVLTIAIYPE
jgi:hypothetical protein